MTASFFCGLHTTFGTLFQTLYGTSTQIRDKTKPCRPQSGLSRAPAPTFTFENLPIQCYETKRATKGRPYSYSTVCYAARSLRSVFPLLCVGVQLGLTPPFLTPHLALLLTYYSILLIVFIFPQYLIFARGCILIP